MNNSVNSGSDTFGGIPTEFKLYAETLDELAIKCGQHGASAVADTRWGAITNWLMRMPVGGDSSLSNSLILASPAVYFARNHDRATLGYPHHRGKVSASPVDTLPAISYDGLFVAAAETVADWERAGGPYLTRDRIKTTQMYISACERTRRERDAPKIGQEGTVETVAAISGGRVPCGTA